MSNNNKTISHIRDFTTGKISRQITALALPLMATSFIQMTYNLVDIMWIGRLGSRSVAAVGTVGMLMWMINSFALISKVGAEVAIGQSIGARRADKAAIYASHTTTLALIMGLTFALVFFLFPQLFIGFFKLEPDITAESGNYLRIVSAGVPFIFLILNFSGIYVGAGRSDIPFYFNASGLVANIILDPLLIFGIGFFPAMGTQGAATATVISQLFVLVLFLWHIKSKRSVPGRFSLLIKPKRSYTLNILKLGIPVAAMNVYFSIINMNLARIASVYGGHIGVTSQTTGGQIEGITWNTSQGFATALGSFVAQNYAARKIDRTKGAFRYTMGLMAVLGIAVSLAFMLAGKEIFSVFVPEREAFEAGGDYLFIIGISQIFMMLELTTQGMFNGMGRTTPPAIISMVFNTVRIPLAILLANRMGVNGVWWAITITTIVKGTLSLTWYIFVQKKVEKKFAKANE